MLRRFPYKHDSHATITLRHSKRSDRFLQVQNPFVVPILRHHHLRDGQEQEQRQGQVPRLGQLEIDPRRYPQKDGKYKIEASITILKPFPPSPIHLLEETKKAMIYNITD